MIKTILNGRGFQRLALAGLVVLLLATLWQPDLRAEAAPSPQFSRFMAGAGPSRTDDGTYHLLDRQGTFLQSNAIAFDLARDGAFEQLALNCRLRVLPGGDGGSFLFLNTSEYGKFGPAPFVKNWTEPNLAQTFAVAVDVHDPPDDSPFGPNGNYRGLPEREVSLHWDGREVVKRMAPVEFRGDWVDCEILVRHVVGGALVSVKLSGEPVFDEYFVAKMLPYESRLALGAGTREAVSTEFDVQDIEFVAQEPARHRRSPKHFEIFNHVLIDGTTAPCQKEVLLPPQNWAFGRLILTLEIHDAGARWDKWDRTGHFYVITSSGEKHDIAPFITSFRTPCHWTVDVTPFRSWLADRVKFEIGLGLEAGDRQGFMLSAALDYYHGQPELEVFQVIPLWVGTAQYGSSQNHYQDFFPSRNIFIDPEAEGAHLYLTTSGHSPVGEFTPSRRTLVFLPSLENGSTSEKRFENLLWKEDVYLNSNRPQFGTWKFSRAGWAPGAVVQPWMIDLTPFLLPGKTAQLSYETAPYDFAAMAEAGRPSAAEVSQARQVVRAYLALYRSPVDLMPAPALQILEVEPGSSAATAGLKPEDYLQSYDGQNPETIEALRGAIREAENTGKKRVEGVIYRGARRIEVSFAPGRLGVLLTE